MLRQNGAELWQDLYLYDRDGAEKIYTAISSDAVLKLSEEGSVYRLFGDSGGIALSLFGTEEEAYLCQVMGGTGYGWYSREEGEKELAYEKAYRYSESTLAEEKISVRVEKGRFQCRFGKDEGK